MSTQKIKLEAIKVTERNPRKITKENLTKLKRSIESFTRMMEMRPLVVDEDYNLLGGNQRLMALQELGYTEVPTAWVNQVEGLTEEEKKEFVIRDNAHYGEWDWDILTEDWGLENLEEFNIDLPGMDINDKDFGDEFKLPANAKSKNEQITFIFSTVQSHFIKDVLHKLKQTDKFKNTKFKDNENSNGNALWLVVSEWAKQVNANE